MDDKQLNQFIEKQFKHHSATAWRTSKCGDLERDTRRVLWAKRGTSAYKIEYSWWPGYLVVTGDVGEAVYSFYPDMSMEDFAGSDLYYFASKCTASEDGRGFESWDGDRAVGWLLDHCWSGERNVEALLEMPYAIEAAYTRGEWLEFLNGPGCTAFGGVLDGLGSIGLAISPRCRYHWLGLRCALRLLGLWRSLEPPIPGSNFLTLARGDRPSDEQDPHPASTPTSPGGRGEDDEGPVKSPLPLGERARVRGLG